MTSNSPKDKRSAPRAHADFVVEIYESDGRTLKGVARLVNLSEFGAGIESTAALSEKSSAVIRLMLGKRHLLTLPVEVMWVRQRGHLREYGLRFGRIPDMVKSVIKKFIDEYFEQPPEDYPGAPGK